MKIFPQMLMFDLARTEGIEKYMEIPKCKACRFVLQSHVRGDSQHLDLRMEVNDHLVGWTLVGGSAKEPIDIARLKGEKKVRAEPKCFSEVCDEWQYSLISVDEDGTPHVAWKLFEPAQDLSRSLEELSRQPKDWLRVHGTVKPGGVGAGKEVEGHFEILSSGRVYFGAQKPYFHEYFLDGPSLDKVRLVVRAIPTQRIDPESKQKIPGSHEVMWNAWIPDDQVPYAITRGRKTDWKPPRGFEPIPPWFKEANKKEYEDWKAWMSGKEKKEEEALSLLDEGKVEEEKISWSLQKSAYKGPTHVRDVPVTSYWLLLKRGEGISILQLDSSPLFVNQTFAVDQGKISSKWWKYQGEVPPGTELFNPTKVLVAKMEVLDSGIGRLQKAFIKGRQVWTLHFSGRKLTGDWTFEQEEKNSNVFIFKYVGEHFNPLVITDIWRILPIAFPEDEEEKRRKKKRMEEFDKTKFILQKHSWDSKEHFDLRIQKEGGMEYWSLLEDPRGKGVEEKTYGYFKICGNPEWMEKGMKGPEKVPIGKTETTVEALDSGGVEIFEDNEAFKSMKFYGKSLKGYYILKIEDGKWFFSKSRLPNPDE